MSNINALIAQGSKFGNAFGNFADSYEEAQKIQQAQEYRNALLQQQQAQDAALAGRHNDQMALSRDQLAATTGWHNDQMKFDRDQLAATTGNQSRNLAEEIRYHNATIDAARNKPPRTGMANVDGRMQLVNLDSGEVVKDLGQAGQRNQAALPAEVAARVGLAENFGKHYPQIRKDIAEGGRFGGTAGRAGLIARTGQQGETYRDIVSGAEAMTRMLTGAGMGQGEAQREADQYLPAWNDSETTILSKLDRLQERLKDMTAKIYEGRGTPQGGAPPTDQPQVYNFNAETGDLE